VTKDRDNPPLLPVIEENEAVGTPHVSSEVIKVRIRGLLHILSEYKLPCTMKDRPQKVCKTMVFEQVRVLYEVQKKPPLGLEKSAKLLDIPSRPVVSKIVSADELFYGKEGIAGLLDRHDEGFRKRPLLRIQDESDQNDLDRDECDILHQTDEYMARILEHEVLNRIEFREENDKALIRKSSAACTVVPVPGAS
jgi:hypothetical protein